MNHFRTSRRIKIFITACLILFIGCIWRPSPGRPDELKQSPESQADSKFGIDYVFYNEPFYQREEWPLKFSETGAGWVNFAGISWASIEPRQPVGKNHTYNWAKLDKAVSQWQKYGFHIALSLRNMNEWASGPIKYHPVLDFKIPDVIWKNTDRLPRSEHMESYRSWIRAMVERYDSDGDRDMPGLKYPVLHYQVGNEYANPMFWTGTIEDYGLLLKETYDAAKSACPDVRIISNGIRWNDLFCDDPDGSHFEKRFAEFLERQSSAEMKDAWRRARSFTEKTVALASYYDILDAGGNGPYPEGSSGYMSWVRREMEKTKLVKAIWDMEARCEPQIAIIESASFHPGLAVPGGKAILEAIRKKQSPDHKKAVEWYRAEQSRVLAKVFIERFAAGFEKVFMGMPHDWNGTPAALTVSNPYMGLLDRNGNPWAAFYGLKLLAHELNGFETAERLPFQKDVELYRFSFPGRARTVYALWLHEDRVRSMTDPLPSKKVSLKDIKGPTRTWEIPLTSRDAIFADRKGSPSGLMLDLTPTPILVEGRISREQAGDL